MKTLKNLFDQIEKLSLEHNDWRKGQVYFNALYDTLPQLAEEIRGSNFDPLYRDEVIPDLIEFLKERGIYETE